MAITPLKWAKGGPSDALPGMVMAPIHGDRIFGKQIFTPTGLTVAPRVTITSNFLDRRLVPFAMTALRRAAVEVRRCYCVVTKSEFAVPLSEQLQTPGFHTDLGGHRHLVSQSRG